MCRITNNNQYINLKTFNTMKRLYYLLVVAFVAMATNASAQFVQSSGEQNSMNGTTNNNGAANFFKEMPSGDYSRFYVGYNPTKIKWKEDQSDWEDALPFKHGVTVGYLHASNLVRNVPLYLEYGANFMYSFGKDSYSEEDYDYDLTCTTKMSMYSLNVPVNLALRLSFNNDKIALTPYVGLNFRVNVAGNRKVILELDSDYGNDTETVTQKLFDSSDSDDALGDAAFKRFQVGLNLGVGLTFNSFYLGVGYVTDFSKIANYEDGDYIGKMGVTTLSLGIAF